MFQYLVDCHEDNLEIFSQRAVVDKMEIVLYFLRHDFIDIHLLWVLCLSQQRILVRESDGSIIGNAGLHGEHELLFRGVEPDIALHFWPWPDKAHVANEHIPQLRQLVYLVFPDKIPHLGYTAVALAYGDEMSFVRTNPHRAELIEPEGHTVFPDAFLGIEPRSLAL